MSEQLGEAVLVLRTDDSQLNRGIDGAEAKADGLGTTFDATSAKAGFFSRALQALGSVFRSTSSQAADMATGTANAGAQVDKAANTVVAAHNRMGASGMILQHVVRGTTDSFAAGMPPLTILTTHIGMLAEAAALSGGSMGKFGEFMAGGWGIALTAGIAVLGTLIGKLIEGSDASGQLHGKTVTLVAALTDQKIGTDAVRHAIEEYNEAQQRARDVADEASDAALRGARNDLSAASAKRELTKALLEQQLSLKGDPGAMAGGVAHGVETGILQAALNQVNKEVADDEQLVRNILINQATDAAKAAADPLEAIRQKYKQLGDAARDAAAKNNSLAAGLQELLSTYALMEKQALDAARAQTTAAHKTQQVGRDMSLADATALVESIGGTVTSGHRSFAKQTELYQKYQDGTGSLAAKPGTSDHERDQGLDIAKSGDMTIAKIRKVFDDAGVHIRQLLDEGNHFHVAWGEKGPSAETLQKRQEAADEKKAANAEAYNQLMGSAVEEQLRLTRQQTVDIAAAADIDEKTVRQQQKLLDDKAQAGVDQKRWSQAQADAVKLVNQQNADLKVEEIERQKRVALAAQQLTVLQNDLAIQRQTLELQGNLATTVDERRRIALEILANEERLAKAQLENAIAAERDPTKQGILKTQLGQLDQQYDLRRQGALRQNSGPLDQYLHSFDDVKSQAEDAVVAELKYVDQGITDAISSRLGVKDPLIKQLLDMLLQQLLLKPIATALKQAEDQAAASGGAGGGLGGGLGGLFGSIASAFSSLFGGGGGDGLSSAFGDNMSSIISMGSALSFGGGLANGGPTDTGHFYAVNERSTSPGLFFPLAPGIIQPPAGGYSTPSGRRSSSTDKLQLEIVDTTGLFDMRVKKMAGESVQAGIASYDQVVGDRVNDYMARRG